MAYGFVLSTCGWCRKVGCVIESHSCLRRFAIYVGHMLPRLLQLAVKYWTSHHASGWLQQLSCPVPKAPTQDRWDSCFVFFGSLWSREKQFKRLLLDKTVADQLPPLQLGSQRCLPLCRVSFKACACELLLWHIWSLGISRDSWLTPHIILKLLPNNHTHVQDLRWLVAEHLRKNKHHKSDLRKC